MGTRNRSLLVTLLLGLATCLLAGCDGAAPPGGPFVWIDAPTDGLSAPADRPLPIEGHATYHGGVARVEIWVNGELHLIEEEPPARGTLVRFEQSWMPPGLANTPCRWWLLGPMAPAVSPTRPGYTSAGRSPR